MMVAIELTINIGREILIAKFVCPILTLPKNYQKNIIRNHWTSEQNNGKLIFRGQIELAKLCYPLSWTRTESRTDCCCSTFGIKSSSL